MNVSVVGLVPEPVQLPDIGYDVPHGIVVHIPTEKANNSKDLWRALAQRRVFRLQGGPFTPNVAATGPDPEVEQLRARVAELETENAQLRAELSRKVDVPPPPELAPDKLDEILRLLKQGGAVAPGATRAAGPVAAPVAAVVEVDAPAFVPATIRGEAVEARVEVQETASEGGGLTDAKNALRKLRRGE